MRRENTRTELFFLLFLVRATRATNGGTTDAVEQHENPCEKDEMDITEHETNYKRTKMLSSKVRSLRWALCHTPSCGARQHPSLSANRR